MRRALQLAGHPQDLPTALRVLELFGRTCTRLTHIILRQKELQASVLDTAIEQALTEVTRELGIGESEPLD